MTLIKKIKEKLVKPKNRQRAPRSVFEIEFADGSTVISHLLDTRILMPGGVEFIAIPQYCGKCNGTTNHFYYHIDNAVRCRVCDNKLSEHDERPLAKVLSFPKKTGEAK